MASGDFWQLRTVPGSSWRLLATPGDSWRILAAPDSSWRLLAAPGAAWQLLLPLAAPGVLECICNTFSHCILHVFGGNDLTLLYLFDSYRMLCVLLCISAYLLLNVREHSHVLTRITAPGGSWRFLTAPGDSWRLLTASGGSWRLLAGIPRESA